MYNRALNDYELIYLVQDQQDMMALELLFNKYDFFIHKKISQFFIFDSDREDFHQEGLIMLNKAILSFKDNFNKTFMRYFEVILDRKFINLTKQKKRYKNHVYEMLEAAIHTPIYIEETVAIEPVSKFKSALEESIYKRYFIQEQSIDYIAQETNLESKQVYNAIYRIKKKLSQSL